MPLKLDNEPELREAKAALFNINSPSGWVLLNYVGPSTVHFSASGEGGPDAITPHFEDDQIQYALVRVNAGSGSMDDIRDVFLTWIGPGVGILEKGNKRAFEEEAQYYLQPFHGDVTVLNRANFNMANLLKKSHPLNDSHMID